MAPNGRYWLALVCGTLAIGSTMTARSTPGGEAAACVELREWARPYANMQPTLDELATHDRAHRIAIFNAVTPEVKAALWQEQLDRFSRRRDLSAAQRALIAEGVAFVTPAFYRGEPSATRASKAFQARAERAFPTVASRRPWYDLGSIGTNGDDIAQLIPRAGGLSCNCRTHADCGGWPCGSTGCTGTPFGCGPKGGSPCNAVCQ